MLFHDWANVWSLLVTLVIILHQQSIILSHDHSLIRVLERRHLCTLIHVLLLLLLWLFLQKALKIFIGISSRSALPFRMVPTIILIISCHIVGHRIYVRSVALRHLPRSPDSLF